MKTQIQTRIGLAVALAGEGRGRGSSVACRVSRDRCRGAALAALLAMATILVPRAEAAGYQMPITFGGYTNRSEALTNFPVLVVFSNGVGSSGFSFSSHPFVTTNGYDLRFYTNATDTGSGLDYEIESWNTNAASYVWVRVPLIPTNGTGSIIAKWGDTAASNQLACTTNGAVWTNGFVGVWHFPNGSALSTADSSSNRNDGTVNGTVTATNGTVNGGANFDGASYLERADNTSLSLSQGTISAWVYLRSDGGMQYPQDNNNILTKGSYAYYFTAGDRRVNLWHGSWLSGTTQFSLNTWVHVAGSFDGSTRRLWLNGVLDTTGSDIAQSGAGVMRIGRRADGQTGYLNGLLDEVRLENVARSTNWVWAAYANMASNTMFSTYGTAGAAGGGATTYKLPMAFTNYTRAEVLTNFPVLVTFSNGLYGTFNYNTFTSPTNGGDLRFMDSSETTYLDFEIEKWATNDASYVWVRVPQLSSNTTIYAKWGGSDTNLPACTTNGAVWDANYFKAVWHMANVSDPMKDSVSNGHSAAVSGTVTFGTNGVVGNAVNFHAAGNGYLNVGNNNLGVDNTNKTISCWVKLDSAAQWGLIDREFDSGGGTYGGWGLWINSSGKSWWWVHPSKDKQDTGPASCAVGQWAYVTVTWNNPTKTVTFYVNGNQNSQTTDATIVEKSSGSINTVIGTLRNDLSSPTYQLRGAMDEARVELGERSSNWVWAVYANQASNAFFNGYGTVQAVSGVTTPPQIQNQTPTGVMTNGATFNGKLVTNGFENAAVYVAWGQTNGSWATTNFWPSGAWTNGSYPSTNMALSANANYYYTFGATNSLTNVVATVPQSYQYLITGEVTVQPTDPTGRVNLADTAEFTVYRPASCTNEALTVSYTLGGTATNGTHYTNSPAAIVTNGTVTIPAGQTNAVITVYPLNLGAPQQTVVLTLASGGYVIGSANSATCTLASIGTQYYTSQTGDWNLSATWGNSGPPSSGDSGVIRHSDAYGYYGAVLATTNLGVAGNYATITVATNGWVAAIDATDVATTIANPVIFDGGRLGNGRWNISGGEWTGPITITTNGLISAPGKWGSPKLSGKVSGPGGITLTTPQELGSGGLTLNNAANDFLGNVVVTQGTLTLACDLALPTGKVVHVYSAGKVVLDVSQTYASEPPPIVNLYGGALGPQVANAVSVTNGLVVNVSAAGGTFNGGKWNSTGSRATGPIAIAAGGTLHVDDSRGGSWALDGPISGAGTLRFFALSGGSLSVSVIAGTNNTHSGGTLVATFGPTETHTTIARTEGSLGTGPVTVETNTIMALDKTSSADWTLTNTLAGAGTFKVEDGSTSYRLTAGGTVSPGTNSGHTAILRVDGKFAFAQNGGTPSTLAIDVASVGATPGVNHDQFTVDHPDTTLASSITNCALVLNRVPTPTAMNGQTLTILSAPGANFSSYQFASVPDLGPGGSVVYGEGSITLTWTAQTPIINNGAFSNLAATSCDVSGYLSSTGASPTVVRCYYGTILAGESGWGYTNDLGTQAVGTVWTSLTGLTSNVKYYYRFYATNDAGEYWSVATSNFTTLADINWNDAASGNWNAGNANTWGAGANVYPQNPLNDHVTVDSHVVTVTSTVAIVAADVALTTSGSVTGTLAFVNADVQNQAMVLDGGRLGVYSDDNGTFKNVVLTNGNLRVKSASQLHLGTHGNRANGSVSTLYGNIEDYGSGTTGVLRVDCDMTVFPSQGFGAAGRLVYNGVSTNFTGGWLIQSANAQALDGGFWLGVYQDGGLGASTVTVTRGQLLINATQSGAAPRPAPAQVIVNPEGRLLIGSGVNVTNWTVDFNGGQMWWYGASKYAGGTLAMNANSIWWGVTAGSKEYAGTISGAGRLDINPTGGSGPFILSGDNSGFSGGIRLLADSLTASHTNGLGTGPVLLASQSGGKLTLDRTSGNFDWTLANNLSGGCTNGSTAVAIQVEDGVGTNTLTVLGTIDPGTNTLTGATNIMGILRVDGSVAFGSGSRLKIDISGTNGVAGVDFDRLLVDHTLTNLANAVLEVNVNTNLAQTSLQGQALVVVSNATTLVGAFGSVQWSGRWTGQVTYNDPPGTVKLSNIEVSQGSVFRFR